MLAALLGGVVGIERESLNRPAGLRTHILVCVGATLIMLVSIDLFRAYHEVSSVDPGRIAAQVVSGIGFLGAGTILREGMTVRGLTTAASLWVTAGIGLAVGTGMVVPAALTSIIVVTALIVLSRVERTYLHARRACTLLLMISDRPGQVGAIGTVLGNHRVNITSLSMRPAMEAGLLQVELQLVMPQGMATTTLAEILLQTEGVHHVEQPS